MNTCSKCDGKHYAKGMCHKHYLAQYHLDNRARPPRKVFTPEERAQRKRESNKQWRLDNIEKSRAAAREYARRYREENAEKEAAARKAYREREEIRLKAREYTKRWNAENPERVIVRKANRRARQLFGGGVVSKDIIQKLRVLQKNKCAACKANFAITGHHLDHVYPLAKGGLHDDTNLQLLCPACNQRKSARDPIEFMQSQGLLL